jgi:hypothetical protein
LLHFEQYFLTNKMSVSVSSGSHPRGAHARPESPPSHSDILDPAKAIISTVEKMFKRSNASDQENISDLRRIKKVARYMQTSWRKTQDDCDLIFSAFLLYRWSISSIPR